MQGVYSKQNTSRGAAAAGESAAPSAAEEPYRMVRVETTLSLAMKPVISAVDTRQSAKPSGAKRGAMQLATSAKMLSCGSAVKLSCGSKFCKNQMTMVAIKITVKARSKKSRAFSQSSWQTFFRPGRR